MNKKCSARMRMQKPRKDVANATLLQRENVLRTFFVIHKYCIIMIKWK